MDLVATDRGLFVETWGCQMNELDSRRFVGLLLPHGFGEVQVAEDADVILLNTCSVRDKAEQKVYARLGQLARLKRRRRGLVLGVCGCVAQQEGQKLLGRLPFVDFVLGTGRIESLPAVVDRVVSGGERVLETGFDLDEVVYTPGAIARNVSYRAAITVIEGCNKHCTFCIVPTTRGRERSRRLHEVVGEVEALVPKGVVEVELLGQTVNAYRDPETGEGLAELLNAVASVDGVKRLRFVTSHPRNFGDDIVEAMARHPNICPALHLPVQSGSSRVLARMKRQYDREEYLGLIRQIRRALPDISLATDLIVGFPGETEEDFQETLSLLEEVRYAQTFLFKYSPRPSTAAARWESDVPPSVASARLGRLNALQQRVQLELNRAFTGRTVEVLTEGDARRGARRSGRSTCNRVVNFDAPSLIPPGRFVNVVIDEALPNSLVGHVGQVQP